MLEVLPEQTIGKAMQILIAYDDIFVSISILISKTSDLDDIPRIEHQPNSKLAFWQSQLSII